MRYGDIQSLFEGVAGAKLQKKIFAQIAATKITYKRLLEDVNKLDYLFQSNGLDKGDRIIMSVNDEYFTALFFLAFLRNGLVTIFLDPEMPAQRATALIEKANVKGLVMDEQLFESRNVIESDNQFYLKVKKEGQKKGRLFKRLLKNKNKEEVDAPTTFPAILDNLLGNPISHTPIETSDLAYVLFTSGTTSEPKGVMITHGNLFAQLHTISNVYGLSEDSRLHNIMPLYNADGIIQGPLLTLYNHATLLRPMRFDLSKISELFHSFYKYRASHFFCVPLILSFMDKFSEGYEDSFHSQDFKCVISSASKLEKKLWEDFERKFEVPVLNVYGMTETVAAAFYCGMDESTKKIGSEGVPIDCEAKITNSDGSLVDENEAGVLWIKGDNIFAGYFENSEATASILEDGWLNTGDVAIRDDKGFYTITGRVKNIIITGGVNIYPEQVTEMINTHPAVLESICLGIKDKEIDEKLVSAIVLKPGSKLDKMELIAFLRPLLKQNQLPKDIFFFDDLPKGLSGKTQISEVKKWIASSIDTQGGKSDSNLENIIISSASQAFGIPAETLTMKDTAQTIDGWDSMAHLIFITSLEKQFDLRFATSEMMTMTSLQTVDKVLNKKLGMR